MPLLCKNIWIPSIDPSIPIDWNGGLFTVKRYEVSLYLLGKLWDESVNSAASEWSSTRPRSSLVSFCTYKRAIDFRVRWIENYMTSFREQSCGRGRPVSRQCACLSVQWAFFKLATAMAPALALAARRLLRLRPQWFHVQDIASIRLLSK